MGYGKLAIAVAVLLAAVLPALPSPAVRRADTGRQPCRGAGSRP